MDKTVSRGLALVVDDDKTNRLVLETLLKRNGFDTISAEDGEKAVEIFSQHDCDIVFMDVMMPVMDGYQATRKIKELCKDYFVPVLFLTALNDEQSLAKCIEAGGDDFISKPYSITILNSKIQAIERVRDMSRKIRAMYTRIQNDEEIAEKIFSSVVLSGNPDNKYIRSIIKSADIFSGDMFISAYSPSRDINILLADFTGHGLAAALGAIPVSEVFRAMTAKGFALHEIVSAINNKLNRLLPSSMFMAAQVISISHELDFVNICNCGMPPVYLKRGNELVSCQSSTYALGVVPNIDYSDEIKCLATNIGDRVILASDGVSESLSIDGEEFGENRIINMIKESNADKFCIDSIYKELVKFSGGQVQSDDISIAEVILNPGLLPVWDMPVLTRAEKESLLVNDERVNDKGNSVNFSMDISGENIKSLDPIPHLINNISQIIGTTRYDQSLFTILTELYMNAVDHGVLELDSEIKDSADGFMKFFEIREKRLSELDNGNIEIKINVNNKDHKYPVIRIRVADSGNGFDLSKYISQENIETQAFGRGIALVTNLCAKVQYEDPGNIVEVVFICDDIPQP